MGTDCCSGSLLAGQDRPFTLRIYQWYWKLRGQSGAVGYIHLAYRRGLFGLRSFCAGSGTESCLPMLISKEQWGSAKSRSNLNSTPQSPAEKWVNSGYPSSPSTPRLLPGFIGRSCWLRLAQREGGQLAAPRGRALGCWLIHNALPVLLPLSYSSGRALCPQTWDSSQLSYWTFPAAWIEHSSP